MPETTPFSWVELQHIEERLAVGRAPTVQEARKMAKKIRELARDLRELERSGPDPLQNRPLRWP